MSSPPTWAHALGWQPDKAKGQTGDSFLSEKVVVEVAVVLDVLAPGQVVRWHSSVSKASV